jgi:hypothetical protein
MTDWNAKLGSLSVDVRRELLLVLTSPSDVRADVVRQFTSADETRWSSCS